MDKKPFEQRSAGLQPDPNKPEPGRRVPEDPEKNKALRRPAEQREARPVDKRLAGPGTSLGDRDDFERDRSDRSSGRPVQLAEHDKSKPTPGGNAPEDPSVVL